MQLGARRRPEPVGADEPDAGPIALTPTTAGLMAASPVRAAAPHLAPGIDMHRVFCAARLVVEERNWRPARPALPGDQTKQSSHQAGGAADRAVHAAGTLQMQD